MTNTPKQWYASWFDTPYYHILYQDRDDEEAKTFMSHLLAYLNVEAEATILDLACGKGRHSRFLSSQGYQVTGIDLSKSNIAFAKQFENDRLKFEVHDMSIPMDRPFDLVLNLFTSFGYFDKFEDNLNTICAIRANLNPGGIGVIDFMNASQVLRHLVENETKTVDGITFNIRRYMDNETLVKTIAFEDNGTQHEYHERVVAFTLEDFETMFAKADLHLLEVFGDYKLNPYQSDTSERLIMTFMK